MLGTAIGALAGILGTVVSQVYTLRRDQAKWKHEEIVEARTWFRGRVDLVTENCLHHLGSLLAYRTYIESKNLSSLDDELKKEAIGCFAWAQKWLSVMLVYWATRKHKATYQWTKDERNFESLVAEFVKQSKPDFELASRLRDVVIRFATREIDDEGPHFTLEFVCQRKAGQSEPFDQSLPGRQHQK